MRITESWTDEVLAKEGVALGIYQASRASLQLTKTQFGNFESKLNTMMNFIGSNICLKIEPKAQHLATVKPRKV